MDSLLQDIRFALLSFSRAPSSFTLAAVLALALGMGSTTAIFSVVQNTLLNPFPYPGSNRLVIVRIHDTAQSEPGGREGYSRAEFFAIQKENRVFESIMGEERGRTRYISAGGTEFLL